MIERRGFLARIAALAGAAFVAVVPTSAAAATVEIAHQNHNPKFLPDDLFRAFDIHMCEGCGRGIHFHLYPAVAVQRAGRVVALRFVCPQGGGSIEVDVDQLKPSMLLPNGEFAWQTPAERDHTAKWWNEPSPFLSAVRGERPWPVDSRDHAPIGG